MEDINAVNNTGTNIDLERGLRDSYGNLMIAGGLNQTDTVITNSETESQEEILPPRNRVLVRQDIVSDWFSLWIGSVRWMSLLTRDLDPVYD